ITELVRELLPEPDRRVLPRVIPDLLPDVTRTRLGAQRGPVVLDEVVADADRQRDPIGDVRNGIMQSLHPGKPIPALPEQVVVLAEPLDVPDVLLPLILAVAAVHARGELSLIPFPQSLRVRGEQ